MQSEKLSNVAVEIRAERKLVIYGFALIAQIVSQASGGTLAKPAATGALEASASIVAQDVSLRRTWRDQINSSAALGPSMLSDDRADL